jgi:transaldolase
MKSVSELRVQIFADGADKASMLELYRQPYIKGFTTNPTLMRATGVTDYQGFAMDLLATIQDRPISFEVFADEEAEMEEQARHIAAWGKNVFVKVPVMNTVGSATYSGAGAQRV